MKSLEFVHKESETRRERLLKHPPATYKPIAAYLGAVSDPQTESGKWFHKRGA